MTPLARFSALALLALALLAAPALAGPVPTPAPATAILMLPEVAEGLIVSFFLLGFALLGVFCVLGIQTPDVMHSTHLPAGKEY
jgi:hypothetical protein